MNLKMREEVGNLFDYQDEYYLAHCIASDFGMMGGIAKQFVDKMDMRRKLISWADLHKTKLAIISSLIYPSRPELVGTSVLVDNTFNLITKTWTHEQPLYEDLAKSLLDMKNQIQKFKIKKLAMPKIGCGIDGLSWMVVSALITMIFKDLDIEIVIVSLQADFDRGDVV